MCKHTTGCARGVCMRHRLSGICAHMMLSKCESVHASDLLLTSCGLACRPGTCEYRSASRIGESDGDINRKRIKAIRQALQKKGWESVGF